MNPRVSPLNAAHNSLERTSFSVRCYQNIVDSLNRAAASLGISRSCLVEKILQEWTTQVSANPDYLDGMKSATRARARAERSNTTKEEARTTRSVDRTMELFSDPVNHNRPHPPYQGGRGVDNKHNTEHVDNALVGGLGNDTKPANGLATSPSLGTPIGIIYAWEAAFEDTFGRLPTRTPKMYGIAKRIAGYMSNEQFAKVARNAMGDPWFRERADLAIIAGAPDRWKPQPQSLVNPAHVEWKPSW
jgi:hypothetical protein